LTGERGGQAIVAPAGLIGLPERAGTEPLLVNRDGLDLRIVDVAGGTHLVASWGEDDGRPAHLDIVVDLPPNHESLNVVIAWSDELFNFTSKHQARPAAGVLVVGEHRRPIGSPEGHESWGVLDVGRGRWPSEITWNWGGGAGRVGEQIVGIQVGAKWTEGSGFTENGIIVDGRLTKIGSELRWDYDWSNPMAPWHVEDPAGQIDIILTPRFDKHSKIDGRNGGSETHQVFGTWSGSVRTDDGVELAFTELQGFAEEARQNW
jgi:hypothetical protein